MSVVLGISAYHADAAAALVVDGRLAAAVAEERFTRVKHWAGFPAASIRSCLETAGVPPSAVDCFAIGRDVRANAGRKLLFAMRHRVRAGAMADRARNWRRVLDVTGAIAAACGLPPGHVRPRLERVEHHPAHLASAFYASPFEDAAVCAIDGFGDFVSTSSGVGRGRAIERVERVFFPHSLGLFYLALTQYLGFPDYGDEYKVMGLAASAAPDLAPALRRLVRLLPRGRFELDLTYFRHPTEGAAMTWEGGAPRIGPVYTPRLEQLLGPARAPEAPLAARHRAIAASLQAVFEEAAFHVLRALHRRTGLPRLCLAGGCALNSVMNGKIRAHTPFRELYVQPAAGDDGTALGAAFAAWHARSARRSDFVMEHAAWGPSFSAEAVRAAILARQADLAREGCVVHETAGVSELTAWTARAIAAGAVVGWFQGRMEWGARALGHRSILADPRRSDMRGILNSRIKLREPFRPFAPSIPEEALDEFFVGAAPDPFMTQVYPVRSEKRGVIPAVTHVDGSGRIHTVGPRGDPLYRELLLAFGRLTGVPVLLNTSFNAKEPIVHRPEEALDCFLRTGMDALALGSVVVARATAPGVA